MCHMLQSLSGQGGIFLRHIFSLTARATSRHFHIHLDSVAKAVLAWWRCTLVIHTDASGVFVAVPCALTIAGLSWSGPLTGRWLTYQ